MLAIGVREAGGPGIPSLHICQQVEIESLASQGIYDIHTTDSEFNIRLDHTKEVLAQRQATAEQLDFWHTLVMRIKAPLPGFIVRKATDALVSASLPGMFASIEREVNRRRKPA